jgi:hypothetical protein
MCLKCKIHFCCICEQCTANIVYLSNTENQPDSRMGHSRPSRGYGQTHGWVTPNPAVGLSLLNPKSSEVVLQYQFLYNFLLYLSCHHIIGCCKTHVLCGLNISYPNTRVIGREGNEKGIGRDSHINYCKKWYH